MVGWGVEPERVDLGGEDCQVLHRELVLGCRLLEQAAERGVVLNRHSGSLLCVCWPVASVVPRPGPRSSPGSSPGGGPRITARPSAACISTRGTTGAWIGRRCACGGNGKR